MVCPSLGETFKAEVTVRPVATEKERGNQQQDDGTVHFLQNYDYLCIFASCYTEYQMNLIKKTGWLILALALFCGLSACKEEEEETTAESMSGAVIFDIPYYVLKGETVTMSASGVIYPETVNYKWFVSGVISDTLSVNTITVQFPDSIGVFTVAAFASAPGFYVNSSRQDVTTVDTTWNASLTGLLRGTGSVVDARDGRSYDYVTLGELDWFSQNLAWQGTGVPFKASKATAPMFGSFYTWEEAVEGQACPAGWRVPTQADWESLSAAMNGGTPLDFYGNWPGLGEKASADARINGDRLWPYSPDNVHSNDFGWNALPLGYTFVSANGGLFDGVDYYGCWWSASEKNGDQAFYRYIYSERSDFPVSYTSKNDMRASVRCVRTHPQSS